MNLTATIVSRLRGKSFTSANQKLFVGWRRIAASAIRHALSAIWSAASLTAPPLAAATAHVLMLAHSSTGVIHSAFLLASGQCFFLFRRDQAFHLLASLLVKFAYLVLFLLWCQRCVRAHGFDLRMRFALNRPALFHY